MTGLLHRMWASAAVTAVLLVASAALGLAQGVEPPNPPPVASPVVPPAPQGPQSLNCRTKATPQEAGGAGLVVDSATGQRKSWQPVGGEVTFAVRSFSEFDAKSRVQVCFQWRTETRNERLFPAEINRTDLSSDGKTLKITVTIPDLSSDVPAAPVRALGLVPIADVHILVQNANASQTVEIVTSLGITHPLIALIAAIIVGALAFWWLLRIARARLPDQKGVNPLLTVISSPSGYASLSQFQVVLWTFVVLVSAIYVMALSGELIQITTGTLILLGISGATTVASKISGNQTPPADAPPPPPPLPHPKAMWSDLITNTVAVKLDDNTTVNKIEIDVTRVQMLFFTLVTAGFVAIQVFTTYVIPEIPSGFQILMGISNAVYMGQKVTQ